MNDLIAQLDLRGTTVQTESVAPEMNQTKVEANKQDSKSRFLARQARKAAKVAAQLTQPDPEADAQLQKEIRDEERAINAICDELGLEIFEVNPDGHCLFSAVADQLALYSILPREIANYANIRLAAANYMLAHPDDFLPFLPSENSGLMSPKEFENYCASMRGTAIWGGEPEILALTRAYNIPIHVIQAANPPVVIHNPIGGPRAEDVHSKRALRISYHRRMYGLGEHYNSLRPKKKSVFGL